MKMIVAPRRAGKTFNAIKEAIDEDAVLLTCFNSNARDLKREHPRLKCITPDELIRSPSGRGRYRSGSKIVVDEEMTLEALFRALGFELSSFYFTPSQSIRTLSNNLTKYDRDNLRELYRNDEAYEREIEGNFFTDSDKIKALEEENEELKILLNEYELGMMG